MFFQTCCSHLKLVFLLGHFDVNFMLETIFGILSSFILKTLKICMYHLTLFTSVSSIAFIVKFFLIGCHIPVNYSRFPLSNLWLSDILFCPMSSFVRVLFYLYEHSFYDSHIL